MYDTQADPPPATRRDTLTGNPFWIGVIVVWILMLVVGFTLAIAFGIWTLIGAF